MATHLEELGFTITNDEIPQLSCFQLDLLQRRLSITATLLIEICK